ncbi:methyltransferase domain-containing protein [Sphingomonas sp. KR1UV-12]|uniref:Methyltransferase domain-containing protein n=1 Tax=Sphingomonas aurea TaxID=3063994 RepID=A0ABT9ELK8_9SPHN|nr:methyltransferase domain-containing protein [Sphingomonas sp. KR1UV-12]MDP1027849.1 methyltransferase domain-containing protein [Sphingomonas sp. KR1UV-12]
MTLARRRIARELMDADDLDADTYAAVVGDLARVNTVTLAARPTLNFLSRIAEGRDSLRILDVGFGDGDMLRRIEHWARKRRIATELVGIDLNPRSEYAARLHTPADSTIRYRTGDYEMMGRGWDAVVSSLVAHHMTAPELVAFLRWMEGHASAWFVNDLHRHGFAYRGFPLLARIARWHPIVRHDGTVSIARAFRRSDWAELLEKAGIADARVFRAFPFRLCVERAR